MLNRTVAIGLAVACLNLNACTLGANGPENAYGTGGSSGVLNGASVTVASKAFTEQLILCEITAQRLESQGASVRRVCGLSGSNSARAAEVSSDVDMYWEYTGTGWLTHLGERQVIADPAEQYAKTRDADLERHQIVWLPSVPANNTYSGAAAIETARRLVDRTMRQLNARVDAEGRTPEEVAGTWLREHGLK